MLDFRFCPAQTLETAGGCVCVRVGVCVCAGTVDRLVSGSGKKSHTTGHHLLYLYLGFRCGRCLPVTEKIFEETVKKKKKE